MPRSRSKSKRRNRRRGQKWNDAAGLTNNDSIGREGSTENADAGSSKKKDGDLECAASYEMFEKLRSMFISGKENTDEDTSAAKSNRSRFAKANIKTATLPVEKKTHVSASIAESHIAAEQKKPSSIYRINQEDSISTRDGSVVAGTKIADVKVATPQGRLSSIYNMTYKEKESYSSNVDYTNTSHGKVAHNAAVGGAYTTAAKQDGGKARKPTEEDSRSRGHTTVDSCSNCGNRSEQLMACIRCGMVKYCDKACQRKDWKEHKRSCESCNAAGVGHHPVIEPNTDTSRLNGTGTCPADAIGAKPNRSKEKRTDELKGDRNTGGLSSQSRFTNEVDICANCGKGSDRLKTCSECLSEKYCDRDCQKMDWKKHKDACAMIRVAGDQLRAVLLGVRCLTMSGQVVLSAYLDSVRQHHFGLMDLPLFRPHELAVTTVVYVKIVAHYFHLFRPGVVVQDKRGETTHILFYTGPMMVIVNKSLARSLSECLEIGNWLCLVNPVWHHFMDRTVGIRINHEAEFDIIFMK